MLNPEEFVGATITEVGVAFGATNTNLVTHAAIKDAEGNPISIGPKTAEQVITIYADIYFELGAFDAMYSGQIRWVQPLANNELLAYLMGGTYPTQQFRVTRAPEFSNGTAPGSHGQSANILVADWIKDAANKKVATPVRRLGVSVGNGEIRGYGLGSSNTAGTIRAQYPISGVYTGKRIEGEVLGVADGVKTVFNPLWEMISNSVAAVLCNDGIEINSADYIVNYGTPVGRNTVKYFKNFSATGGVDPLTIMLDQFGVPSAGTILFYAELPAELISEINQFAVTLSASLSTMAMHSRENSGDAWTQIFSVGTVSGGVNTYNITLPAGHKLLRFTFTHGSTGTITVSGFQLNRADWKDIFKFHTPPASGTITAEYTVPYVPKDSNHVLDLQATIQYGEIV